MGSDHPGIRDEDLRRLSRARPRRASIILTAVLDPLWVVGFVWVVACLAVPGIGWSERWIFLGVGLVSLVGGPYGSLMVFLHSGRVSDRQVVRRRERYLLYVAIAVWVVAGCLVVVGLRAPSGLIGVVVAMLAGLVLVAVANLFAKASLHSAVCAGAAVVLLCLWWPLGLVVGVATPLVAWARWNEGRHSAGQVVAGVVLGVVGGASYLLF